MIGNRRRLDWRWLSSLLVVPLEEGRLVAFDFKLPAAGCFDKNSK